MFPPSRIVYLTEETVETLYLLGEQDRIVGISAMSCARLKHSLTVPAYSEQRSTLAERSEVHASGGLGTGDRGTCCEGAGRDEPPNRGGPVVPTGRENIVASADCGHDGRVHGDLVWSKLRTLVESARLAWTSLRTN